MRSRSDTLRREFETNGRYQKVTAVGLRDAAGSTLGCVLDEKIVGEQYARLLREMALKAKIHIRIGDGAISADRILVMGRGVSLLGNLSASRLWLLAPEIMDTDGVAALSNHAKTVDIILPEIDEDGRVNFWEEISKGTNKPHFKASTLPGVGNRIDWAWSEMIEIIKAG
jgi:hypothetical protein